MTKGRFQIPLKVKTVMAKLVINTFLFLLIILVVIMAGCVSEKTKVATLPKSHQFVESVPHIVSHHPKLYKEHLKQKKKGIGKN